jgi:hypothetical protein
MMFMCNDYEQRVRWAEYCKMMQISRLGSQQSSAVIPTLTTKALARVGQD